MKQSKLFSLSYLDFAKGLVVAILTAVLTGALQMLTLVPPAIDWKQIGVIAITSAIAYLLQKFGTNSQGVYLESEKSIIGGRPDDRK